MDPDDFLTPDPDLAGRKQDPGDYPEPPGPETFRCTGCGEYTAPARYMLCAPCVRNRPNDEHTDNNGDVGFEGDEFY